MNECTAPDCQLLIALSLMGSIKICPSPTIIYSKIFCLRCTKDAFIQFDTKLVLVQTLKNQLNT